MPIFKPQFYEVHIPDTREEEIIAKDGENKQRTDEAIDYLRLYIKKKDMNKQA